MPRLSPKQKGLLQEIADAPLYDGKPGCLYLPHWSRFDYFTYEREAFQFARNLESRGFLTIQNYSFLYLTETGRAALA